MIEKKKIVVCATMDTKGDETVYLKERIEEMGHEVCIIDVGLRRLKKAYPIRFTQEQVAFAANASFEEVMGISLRVEASRIMMDGLRAITQKLYANRELDGIISLGGSGGTTIASGAMQALPLGIPKVIVGTMASGNTLPYVQGQDILLINSVVDIQSLNFMSRFILAEAARIVSAMVGMPPLSRDKKEAIAISCFGVTTPCVQRCRELLEGQGYEIVVFHARGVSGGKIMEKMIREDFFCGVLDITATELIDEVAGGAYVVGPDRLRGAVKKNLPYIVVPGAAEMINIGPEELLKPEQKDRLRYYHNSNLIKLRANRQEMIALASLFAERLKGGHDTKIVIPTRGFSEVDKPGGVFYDPATNKVFIQELNRVVDPAIPIVCRDNHINDTGFADYLVKEILSMISWNKSLGR